MIIFPLLPKMRFVNQQPLDSYKALKTTVLKVKVSSKQFPKQTGVDHQNGWTPTDCTCLASMLPAPPEQMQRKPVQRTCKLDSCNACRTKDIWNMKEYWHVMFPSWNLFFQNTYSDSRSGDFLSKRIWLNQLWFWYLVYPRNEFPARSANCGPERLRMPYFRNSAGPTPCSIIFSWDCCSKK